MSEFVKELIVFSLYVLLLLLLLNSAGSFELKRSNQAMKELFISSEQSRTKEFNDITTYEEYCSIKIDSI